MKRFVTILLLIAVSPLWLNAQEIGFIEDFAVDVIRPQTTSVDRQHPRKQPSARPAQQDLPQHRVKRPAPAASLASLAGCHRGPRTHHK